LVYDPREPKLPSFVNLHGYLSDDEVLQATDEGRVVAKYGRATGLTFGIVDCAKSVMRKDSGEILEWAITTRRDTEFCKEGDSGAAIWAVENKRVLGILTSQTSENITYATAMPELLEDIGSHGLRASIP
jgi:hypothetical protein